MYNLIKYPYIGRLSSFSRRCYCGYCFIHWRDLEFFYNLDVQFYKNLYGLK